MMKIKALIYNWRFSNENGEEVMAYYVGSSVNNNHSKCLSITEHAAYGEGDKWYYDVHFEDGTMERIFNPNQVFFYNEVF